MHADPKAHSAHLGQRLVARRDVALDLHGALDGLDDARELGQQVVPRRVDDSSAPRFDAPAHGVLVVAEGPHRAGLVLRHEPAVGDGVRGQDRGEPALGRAHSFASAGSATSARNACAIEKSVRKSVLENMAIRQSAMSEAMLREYVSGKK